MKVAIVAFFACGLLSACAQVQNDGARTLGNANSVVSSAGGKVWTGTPKENAAAEEQKKKKAQQ